MSDQNENSNNGAPQKDQGPFDLKKHFATNKDKENEGTWVELPGKARVLVARWGNIACREYFRRKTKGKDVAIQKRLLPEHVQDAIMIDVIANTILLGWENIFFDGKPFPYTTSNAIYALTELRDFRDTIVKLCEDENLYKLDQDEQIAKNSQSALSGS